MRVRLPPLTPVARSVKHEACWPAVYRLTTGSTPVRSAISPQWPTWSRRPAEARSISVRSGAAAPSRGPIVQREDAAFAPRKRRFDSGWVHHAARVAQRPERRPDMPETVGSIPAARIRLRPVRRTRRPGYEPGWRRFDSSTGRCSGPPSGSGRERPKLAARRSTRRRPAISIRFADEPRRQRGLMSRSSRGSSPPVGTTIRAELSW